MAKLEWLAGFLAVLTVAFGVGCFHMLAELSVWQKLWNKGVDITSTGLANGLSAVLTAVIALLGWKLKLWLDLKKEKASLLQAAAIKDEGEREKTRESRRLYVARLKSEMAAFGEATRKVTSAGEAAELSLQYVRWLQDRHLITREGNLLLIHKWGDPWNSQVFVKQDGFDEVLNRKKLAEFEKDIRGTEIPDESDSTFVW